jgi:predicted MPP superfamily phosphohydrolase
LPWSLRMMLFTFAIALLPYTYMAWRLINALAIFYPHLHKSLKIIIPLIFLLVNLFPIITGMTYILGHYQNLSYSSDHFTVFDMLIVIPYWIGLIIILESFPYILLSDLILLVSRWFSVAAKANLVKWIALLKIILFVFFILFVLIRVYLDTTKIKLTEYTVAVKGLSPELESLNFVLTADIQVDQYSPEEKIETFKKDVADLDPDLLFFAGDLVTSGTSFIDEGISVLCDTKARLDRIACVGDHDTWSDAGRIARGIQNCGWNFLDDQHKVIRYKDKKILVTGVSYVYSKRISPSDLKELMGSAPEADLKILLVHQPSEMVMRAAAEHGYDILLAGHTHGGQIIFRPFGLTITPTQTENKIFNGIHKIDDMSVIITNGIGMSLVPLRYRASAEIVQFRLKRAE